MKKTGLLLLVVLFVSNMLISQNKITFTVDMSKVENAKEVGIRGDVEPLSWTKTTPMKGPDSKGCFTLTIDFGKVKAGTKLSYKYMHQDTLWGNNMYGPLGNRTCILSGTEQKLQTDIWNELEKFDKDLLYDAMLADLFYSNIFLIHVAKVNNKSMQDLAKENQKFWGGQQYYNWHPSPEEFMVWVKVNMSRYPLCKFEILENQPNHTKFRFNKFWNIYFGEQLSIKDVTQKDFMEYNRSLYELITKDKDLQLEWEETENHLTMSIKKK